MFDVSARPDPTDFETPQAEQDAKLLVKFYIKARPDPEKSVEMGRPMYKDVEYIDIRVPGSTVGAARPATFQDKQRFPRHYEAFKQRIDMPETGTPLIQWPPMSRAMVEQLAHLNIKTVEHLAEMNDSDLQRMAGLGYLKSLAVSYMAAAKSDAPLAQLHAELAERDSKIAVQEQTIKDLADRLTALETDTRAPQPAASYESYEQEVIPAQGPVVMDVPESAPLGAYHSVLDSEPEPEADLSHMAEVVAEPEPTTGRRRSRRPPAED